MMKKKKNADVVETEAAEAVTEETKTSEDKKPETETAEDIEKKAEEEAAEIEAYDAEGNPILKKKKKRKSKKKKTQKPEEVNIVKELLSLIIYIGIVVLICYFILNFVGCRSKVDGSSMNPTLEDKDNLWVDKLSYTFGDPKRFDVVIFNYDENTTYVKRIIGLPGETVRIDQNGNIYINGKLLKENYGKETMLNNGRMFILVRTSTLCLEITGTTVSIADGRMSEMSAGRISSGKLSCESIHLRALD